MNLNPEMGRNMHIVYTLNNDGKRDNKETNKRDTVVAISGLSLQDAKWRKE